MKLYQLDSVGNFLPGEEVAIFKEVAGDPVIEIVTERGIKTAKTNTGRILSDENNDHLRTFLTGNYFPQYDATPRI